MSTVYLLPGDVACVQGTGILFRAIRLIQYIHSRDNESTYGHSFVVLDGSGDLLDTRWRVGRTHISRYAGQRMIIARPLGALLHNGAMEPISESARMLGLTAIEVACSGKWYPVHRLLFHLIPPVAKFIHAGPWQVCSERVAGYLRTIGARPLPIGGTTPDMLADEWRRWRNFQIIYEGVWGE